MTNCDLERELSSAHRDLIDRLKTLLAGSLGIGIRFPRSSPRGRRMPAPVMGLLAAFPYACVAVFEYWVGSPKTLILLSCWGGFYFGLVVALTRATSPWVEEAVETLLVPSLSEQAAQTAFIELETNFRRPRILVDSVATSILLLGLSCWLLRDFHPWDDVLWLLGYFCLYLSGAIVTLTTRVYRCFGSAIKEHPEQLFRFDPANSPAIVASRALANRVLRYWFCVFVLVVTIVIVPWIAKPKTSIDSGLWTFVLAVIAIAGFFSFVFGSLVYLGFESDIHNAVERVRFATLGELQRTYEETYGAGTALQPSDGVRLEQLAKAYGALSAGSLSRSAGMALADTLVGIVPVITGIVAAVVSILKYRQQLP